MAQEISGDNLNMKRYKDRTPIKIFLTFFFAFLKCFCFFINFLFDLFILISSEKLGLVAVGVTPLVLIILMYFGLLITNITFKIISIETF